MIFDYKLQKSYAKSLEVEDIGNFCFRALSEEGVDYYFLIKTLLGKSYCLKFGPILADSATLQPNFELKYRVFDFKEKAIIKEAQFILDNPSNKIYDAEIVTETEALESLPDVYKSFLEGE